MERGDWRRTIGTERDCGCFGTEELVVNRTTAAATTLCVVSMAVMVVGMVVWCFQQHFCRSHVRRVLQFFSCSSGPLAGRFYQKHVLVLTRSALHCCDKVQSRRRWLLYHKLQQLRKRDMIYPNVFCGKSCQGGLAVLCCWGSMLNCLDVPRWNVAAMRATWGKLYKTQQSFRHV